MKAIVGSYPEVNPLSRTEAALTSRVELGLVDATTRRERLETATPRSLGAVGDSHPQVSGVRRRSRPAGWCSSTPATRSPDHDARKLRTIQSVDGQCVGRTTSLIHGATSTS
jgi:hypothetical protein